VSLSDVQQPVNLLRLAAPDVELMRALNALFAQSFADPQTYLGMPPSDAYLKVLLSKDDVFAIVAEAGGEVLAGLVAYQLDKFEQARSEIYIYDLAVAETCRRRGLATALIASLQQIAATRGAWVIFVQANHGDEDAIALYERLGTREEVLHFDIQPGPTSTVPLSG
jgi:aminoglycoside 3-N-acetyltransferase I